MVDAGDEAGYARSLGLDANPYCPVVQAELFMPAAQLGSPSDLAIAIMLHESWVRSMHLK
jgi:hypothetical protein